MANYYAAARSNYFLVKDEAAFRAWADLWDLQIFECNKNIGMLAIAPGEFSDDGAWPGWRTVEEGEDIEFDAVAEISPHLVEGQVAVLVEAGAEKLRYVSAWTIAIHSSGKHVSLSLNNIYDIAKKKFPGSIITAAEY